MKKHLHLGLLATLVVILCGLTSCKKEQFITTEITRQTLPDPAAISKASYAEQVAYTHEYLAVLGKALVLLQNDERIRGLMYAELDSCKPGLENVLFKTLIDKAMQQGINLETEMNQALVRAGIKQTVTNSFAAFKNIDGVTWQPQIYLPNYAELKKSGKVGNKAIHSKPAFFTYAGEENVTAYQTFRADKTNTAIIKAFTATQESVATNEVLIIGLSEKLLSEPSTNNDAYKANAGNKTMGTPVKATIGMMSVKTNRESWAGGASEVHCTGATLWNTLNGLNPYNPPNNSQPIIKSTNDFRVDTWTRKEVDQQTWKTVDFNVVNHWNPYWYPSPGYHETWEAIGDTAPYIIYEEDAWPSPTRGEVWQFFGRPITASYRSSDNPFHDEIITTDPYKASNNSGWYSEPRNLKTTSFNYKGHYPITTEIQYWFY